MNAAAQQPCVSRVCASAQPQRLLRAPRRCAAAAAARHSACARAAAVPRAARIACAAAARAALPPPRRCLAGVRLRAGATLSDDAPADPANDADADDAQLSAAAAAPLDVVGELARWALAPPPPPLLCAADAGALRDARAAGTASVRISLDLGRTTLVATFTADGASLPLPSAAASAPEPSSSPLLPLLLPWSVIEAVADDANGVHQLLPPDAADAADAAAATSSSLSLSVSRVATFSRSTARPVSLFPPPGGRGPPSALVAGFSMHRFGRGVDPSVDTARKIAAISPIRPGARVLDICTGLGYTALAAARRGAAVTTIELDDAMQAMCLANPYSRMDAAVGAIPSSKGTFASAVAAPGSVTQLRGCAAALVAALPDASFDRILHDPPTFALAGALFSADFYAQLARILAPKVR
jgi:predicted methyltransferase